MTVRILDCTLRDGGYVNNFAFGSQTAKAIFNGLIDANVEYIEIGFLRNVKDKTETTVFTSFDEAHQFLSDVNCKSKIFTMIMCGKFDIDKIPPKSQTKIDGIRVAFKKHEADAALDYIKQIKKKGYIVSANPTVVHCYTDEELLSIIKKINNVHPDIFALVDTFGVLNRDDMCRFFYLINHNLLPDITLAFHSHNNLQLSFSNAQVLFENKSDREIIIDSSIQGMGRGAGNLCTELLLQYLNDSCGKQYNLLPILRIIEEQIEKIFIKTPWGYSVPYYLAASLKCHPNYASFLKDKATVSVESISEILGTIPDDKRSNYDEKLIQFLYLKYQTNKVNDDKVLEELRKDVQGKTILILAPGKTVASETEKIQTCIAKEHPYIISVNFRPPCVKADKIFISNVRRFSEQTDLSDLIVTSNIQTTAVPRLNYGSYLNSSDMADNSVLMLLKVLMKIGVKSVYFAGLDGFAKDSNDNYYSPKMINNARLGEETDRRNAIMSKMLKEMSQHIKIRFITTSLYES